MSVSVSSLATVLEAGRSGYVAVHIYDQRLDEFDQRDVGEHTLSGPPYSTHLRIQAVAGAGRWALNDRRPTWVSRVTV